MVARAGRASGAGARDRGIAADPDGILAYIARVLPPIGIVVGMYIFWVGADHPGGKFQGATILAAMWLLTIMAGLTDMPPISRSWLRSDSSPGRWCSSPSASPASSRRARSWPIPPDSRSR